MEIIEALKTLVLNTKEAVPTFAKTSIKSLWKKE